MSDNRPDAADSHSTPSPDGAWRPDRGTGSGPDGAGGFAGGGEPAGDSAPAGSTDAEGTPTGEYPTEQLPTGAPAGEHPTEQLPTGVPTDGHPTGELPTAAPSGPTSAGAPASPWVNPGGAAFHEQSGNPSDAAGAPGHAPSSGPSHSGIPTSEGTAGAAAGSPTPWGSSSGTGDGSTVHGGASAPFSAAPQDSAAQGSAPDGHSSAGTPDWGAPAYGAPPTGDPGAYTQYAPVAPAAPSSTRTRRSKGRGPGWLALLVAMVITALLAVGTTLAIGGGTTGASSTSSSSASSTQTSAQTVAPVQSSGDSPDWEAVAAAVSPATVTITVESSSSSDIGSGIVYDASGHIVTNYHVVSAAISSSSTSQTSSTTTSGTITVSLSDGTVYDASVVSYDQTTDLAVLQLKNPPSDLTVATFGSSADLVVGQAVMAIGSPLGLSDTVTTGVVSALNRPVEVSTSETQETDPNDPFGQLPQQGQSSTTTDSVITNAIQVDASINPGNSGGPLFDSTGAVIGINFSIASLSSSSDSSGSIGLGFAIPSDLVKSVTDQLISTGTVDHAVLGVTIQSGTATVDGTTRVGAEVASVTSGGAADKAGIKEGDVILSVDGNQVTSAKSLSGYVRRYKGGDTVTIEFARDGKVEKVEVTLASMN